MSILEEALQVSGENRQRDYGHPLENHERIAAVWNVVLGKKLTKPITPEEVVWCMIGVKLAREVNSPKRDNSLDVAGYVNCLDLIEQRREQQRIEKVFTPKESENCKHPRLIYRSGSFLCADCEIPCEPTPIVSFDAKVA